MEHGNSSIANEKPVCGKGLPEPIADPKLATDNGASLASHQLNPTSESSLSSGHQESNYQ
jgi:hypothetical protein